MPESRVLIASRTARDRPQDGTTCLPKQRREWNLAKDPLGSTVTSLQWDDSSRQERL